MKEHSEQSRSQMSERLKFILTGMSYAADTDDELNVALNWFYFALLLSMADPMAAAGLLLELEDQEGWTREYRRITRDNVRLALEQAPRFLTAQEASA